LAFIPRLSDATAKSAEGAIDMLSNDDIDRLLAIGEQQRAELLAQRQDRATSEEGSEGEGDGALAEMTGGTCTESS
jgi:hypothetical protein